MATKLYLYAIKDNITGLYTSMATGYSDFRVASMYYDQLQNIDFSKLTDDQIKEYEKSVRSSCVVRIGSLDQSNGHLEDDFDLILDLRDFVIGDTVGVPMFDQLKPLHDRESEVK